MILIFVAEVNSHGYLVLDYFLHLSFLDLITFGYSTLVWFYIFTKKKSILLNFVKFCLNFIIVPKSIVHCFSFFC